MTMNEKNKVYELTKFALDGLTTEEKLDLDWAGLPSPEHAIVVTVADMLNYDASNDEIEEIVNEL